MLTQTREDLRTKGYALVPTAQLGIDASVRAQVNALASEWDHLETDKYLANGARFRERRYDRFHYLPTVKRITLRPHRPYFQSMNANKYAGGIERTVAPLSESTVANPLLRHLIEWDFAQFPVAQDLLEQPWDVQCHQFRIISTPEEVGEPTPEGPHRDEVHFGGIHLITRTNAEGGYSQVYSKEHELLAEFQLAERLDTMYWADELILHAVTPITPTVVGRPAVRDVLILGYRCSPGLSETD